jgi:hypothetical protein
VDGWNWHIATVVARRSKHVRRWGVIRRGEGVELAAIGIVLEKGR